MDLYLFFEVGKDGLLYQYNMRHPEQYTPEKMMEEIERVGYDTLEHFLTTFDQSVVEGKFIGAAVIEFVRQFDTERGNRYAQHRLDYIARQEEKHRRLAAERAEKAAQKEAQRKAAEQAARAKYLGWADQMTAMQFGKVSSVLDVLIRVDGKVMTKREFVISRMKDGWTPTKKEGVVSYYHRPQQDVATLLLHPVDLFTLLGYTKSRRIYGRDRTWKTLYRRPRRICSVSVSIRR